MKPFVDHALEAELPPGGLVSRAANGIFCDLAAYLKKPIAQIASEYWQDRQGQGAQAVEQRLPRLSPRLRILSRCG